MEDEDLPSALILVLDMNQAMWAERARGGWPAVQEVLESLLAFIRAFFLLHAGNSVAVIAAHPGGADLLYPGQRQDDGASTGEGAAGKRKKGGADGAGLEGLEMDSVDRRLHAAIVRLAKGIALEGGGGGASMVSSAFAMAACRCNRILSDKSPKRPVPRLLVVSPFEDLPGQYIPIMNSIFSFQKGGVLVDSLVMCDSDCRLLQQASDITHGAYLRPMPSDLKDSALLQYLLTIFLPDKRCRFRDAAGPCALPLLRVPRPKQVDYRAACFKTSQPIDTGFVCSVCLAIYSEPVFVCAICDSKIAIDRTAAKPGGAAKGSAPKKKRKEGTA